MRDDEKELPLSWRLEEGILVGLADKALQIILSAGKYYLFNNKIRQKTVDRISSNVSLQTRHQ